MRRAAFALSLCLACSDEPGSAEDTEDTSGATTQSPTAAAATDESTTSGADSSSGAMFTATAMADSSDSGSDTRGGSAIVVFTLGEEFDYDFEELNDADIQAIELLNIGSADATALGSGAPIDPPFGFTGGSYPGSLGNCGATLTAGEMCAVHVAFTPTTIGPASATLTLQYEGGDMSTVSLALIGEGRGTTDNQVADGDFEACAAASAPTGWDQGDVDHWECSAQVGGVIPHGGTSMLAVVVPNATEFAMTYRLDLTGFPVIADGEVTATASAWVNAPDGDDVEFEVTYLDAGRGIVDAFDPGATAAADWTQVEDTRPVPSGTAFADLTVRCIPQTAACDAFVDDVLLTLTL